MSDQKQGTWEEEFDKEFSFWKDVVITPRQAGDIKLAEIAQAHYRGTGEQIKSFIRSLLADRVREIRDMIQNRIDTIRQDVAFGLTNEDTAITALTDLLSSPLVDENV